MTSTQPEKTAGQLERELSQGIQALYKNRLGQRPSKATCQLFDTKLAIVLEDSVTQPEQLLAEEGQQDLAERVRDDLDQAMRPQLKNLIEKVLQVEVLDMMSDATLETKRTGIIVILSSAPVVRNPEAIPKSKRAKDALSEVKH